MSCSSSSASSNSGLLGPGLRRDVDGLSHRLSVLKAGLADLASSGGAGAKASKDCRREVHAAEEFLAEVKQVSKGRSSVIPFQCNCSCQKVENGFHGHSRSSPQRRNWREREVKTRARLASNASNLSTLKQTCTLMHTCRLFRIFDGRPDSRQSAKLGGITDERG